MKHRIFSSITIAACLILGASAASAALVIPTGDDQEIAKAILGLEVNGSEYYVNFEPATANDIYGPTEPRSYTFDNVGDAQAANDAIIAALNAHTGAEITLVGGVLSRNNSNEYSIGYGDMSGNINVVTAMYDGSTDWINNGSGAESASDEFIYAEFTQMSPVPIPAAAWLFGSALIGLAGIKRKK